MASELRLNLLGVPELLLGDLKLTLPTRKLLGLLAYLALEGPTSRAKLADLFWSESDQEGARGNLRRELNRLRHTPLAQHLQTERDILKLASISTDVEAFVAHIQAGDLEAALSLYRSLLLEGLELSGAAGFEEWLFDKREELAGVRRNALSQQAGQLEAAGDLRGALSAHLELLREDELQELYHRQAMRLHALLGEREAALERFERLKTLLERELHLEPLPETTQLAVRIRTAQMVIPEKPPLPSSPIPSIALNPPLIGRENEWTRLEEAWAAGKVILIAGEPGVGKSRLLQEFAVSKGRSLPNQGRPGDGGIPYATLSRTIVQILQQRPNLDMAAWVRQELSRLVPQLFPEIPPPIASAHERLRFFDAFAEFTRVVSEGVSSIVSDDLHFFDPESFEMGFYSAQRYTGLGHSLHLLAAFRSGELRPEAERLIEQLVASGQGVLVELQPLTEVALLRLVRAMSGSSGTRFTQRLYRATGGNPLFVTETLKALFASGELRESNEGWITPYDQATDDYRELPLPASVREVVLRRVEGLGAAPRRLLEAAGLAGDGFGLEQLLGATALSEWESVEALECTLQAGLIEQGDAGYRFHHDLVRRAVSEGMSEERRKLLHRKLAANLERLEGPPAQIAEHLELGGRPKEAIPWRVRAAEAAVRVYAHTEALEQYAKALQNGADPTQAFAIHRARIEIWADQGNFAQWAEELERMEGLVVQNAALEIPTALARVRLVSRVSRFEEALGQAEAILKRSGLSPTQLGQARYEKGLALVQLGRVQAGEACLQETLEQLPPELSNLKSPIYNSLFVCAWRAGDWKLAEERARLAYTTAKETANPMGQMQGLANLGKALMQKGDYPAALEWLEAALALASSSGNVFFQRQILLDLYYVHYYLDDFDAGIARLEEGLRLAKEPQDPLTEGAFLNNLGFAYRQRGQLGAALQAIQTSIEIADQIAMPLQQVWRRITLADLWLDIGTPKEAEPLLSRARELIAQANLQGLALWLAAIWTRYAWLALGQTDTPRLEQQLTAGGASAADQARARWVLGGVRLARGELKEALETVAGLEDSAAMRPRGLALVLKAQVQLRQVNSSTLEQAEALLSSGKLPALEQLELEHSLRGAYVASGALEVAQRLREQARCYLLELAQSLSSTPELRQNFLDLYPDLASR